MDLSTQYLGFTLPNPFMPGASPLVDDLDVVRRLEDAGAAAIVMHSLFEEQLSGEQRATHHYFEHPAESFAEALTFMPDPENFTLGPGEYLEQIHRVKQAVDVPVIGSLNGTTPGGWLEYARLIADAGADAIELNVYQVPTDPREKGDTLEQRTLETVRAVLEEVDVPVAVKLSPFYSALAHFAAELDRTGVKGLVLFNRFYQPDIDVEELEVVPAPSVSEPSELLLRLRWLAILSGHIEATLAVTGGVHTIVDAVKAVMAGTDAIQLVSVLLQKGPEEVRVLREELARWLEDHEYSSLQQMRGSMNLKRCPDPAALERAHYIEALQSWKGFF